MPDGYRRKAVVHLGNPVRVRTKWRTERTAGILPALEVHDVLKGAPALAGTRCAPPLNRRISRKR